MIAWHLVVDGATLEHNAIFSVCVQLAAFTTNCFQQTWIMVMQMPTASSRRH